ncbi:serine/threonine-protein kinase PITSLRE isoform X2 [Stomoxys calcitrans]|uniref:cyclin-dependent kinase n=1 Tax=Stomoxys calcitrans TaxID=35570 RepID=A0A1I8Q7S2_STOCA|nr:serine/threonine-protein kinase PITSLRE isoform X2 [Stomoxys calcitrans]
MSGSEDGQLRSPMDVHMLSGDDEEHDTDSLDIKPPQAQVARDISGSRRKERSKDKKHSKERRQKERERYTEGSARDKKDYRERDERHERRGSDLDRKDMKRSYDREEYLSNNDKRYHKHYDHMGVGENNSRSRGGGVGNIYHQDVGGGGGYHHGHEHQYHQYHMQQQRTHYPPPHYHHHHHQTPTDDYHQQQRHHQQAYDNARALASHKHYEQRKYYDQPKDPESLEQDLRSRLLSKRHKYVKGEVIEVDDVYERPERLYDEREGKSLKSERHKARRKDRENNDTAEYIEDTSDGEHQRRRKKHKRHKDKHAKRYVEDEDEVIEIDSGEPAKAAVVVVEAEKKSPEDPELIARRAKILAAEQEKDKRRDIARKELEARRELIRERSSTTIVDTLSPTAVAASVTASLHVIKRKHNEKEEKTKRKRLKKTKGGGEEDDDDEDDSESDSSDDSQDSDEEKSGESDDYQSDQSGYKKSKSKSKKTGHGSEREISDADSPLSIGELSKSPADGKSKTMKKKAMKSRYKEDEEAYEGKSVDKHKKRSETISLSPSSNSRSRSHTPTRSRSRSRSKSYNSGSSRSRSHSSSLSSERSRSRSRSRSHSHSRRSRSSSRSDSRSRTSRSRSGSRSRSRSRSRSEERDMKANSHREEKENRDNENDRKKTDDQSDAPILDDKGNPLPNYFPGIQGCRSVEEFQCLNRIEEGTYGVVYRAKDKRTNEIVALKRLKMEKEKEGFPITSLREINTLLKGQHPNIVTVREIVVGSNMDKIFIVMDYVEHDLKSLMETMKAKKQSFFPGEVKCLTQQLLRAVGHLHDNWILHRDLKTSNLLLSHKGILKVGDFGLAREYGSPLKKYTSLVVTLWYRAPELLLCSPEYSTPIDIWSLGCIFAEFLQMAPLFPGKTEVDELNKIFKELGTPNEKIWPGYNELPAVKNMLSQNSQFADYPVSSLRKHFADKTSDMGIELLQGLLTYNPKQRLTAEGALKHQYFKELPVPIDPSMFPTWPAKSELGARKAMASSPKPPSGGSQFKQLGRDDVAAGGGSGSKLISGIITGNKKSSANTGFVLNSGIEQRQLAMGPGFNLKF